MWSDEKTPTSWVSAEDYEEDGAESLFGTKVALMTLYSCDCGHETLDNSEVYDMDKVWVCGECGSQYGLKEKAGECCL